jgi:predicted porin
MSGDWGRVDFGGNNGVAYLLQVVAPAADSNYDGMRQYVRAVNYALAPAAFAGIAAFDMEYAQDTTASSDKINYMTPVWNGFQAGVSWTPDVQATAFVGNQESTTASRGLAGVAADDVAGAYGSGWDVAAHYETKISDVEIVMGAGYILVEQEQSAAGEDDLHAWNIATAIQYNNLGLGMSYSENDNGTSPDKDTQILVIGADYKIEDWKLGASWYTREDDNFAGPTALETDRYSLGAGYTYGPGMSVRGSVHYIDHEVGAADMDATTFLLGTQINF